MMLSSLLAVILIVSAVFGADPPVTSRINCFPEQEGCNGKQWRISKGDCEARGCTYNTNVEGRECAPICYMHPDRIGYKVVTSCENCNDKLLYAELAPLSDAKVFDPSIKRVVFSVTLLTDYHLQFKIEDLDNKRFEVPFVPPEFEPSSTTTAESALFRVQIEEHPFSFKVIRKSSGVVLFDTSLGGFVFSNRYLQLTDKLATSNLYGLGEHEHPSLKHSLDYKTWAMFDRDQPGLGESLPLYGTHGWYMVLENDGNAHAVFMMNSNAQEYSLIPAPGVIIRTIGGIFDFHIYAGPSPANVVQQYTEYVGRPFMPPYWSLGFQIARWGYRGTEDIRRAVERTRQYGIPLDVVYADIDHMDGLKDFTLDRTRFGDLPSYLSSEREANGLRNVIILDPAISMNATNYEAWNVLNGNKSWVTWPDGEPMIGYVWAPGKAAFPDFFLERTQQAWKDLIVRHSQVIPFDGLWIDMNEPSNFGTNEQQPWNWPQGLPPWSLKCPITEYEDPPYRTYAISRYDEWNKKSRLSDKTLCMEARQGDGKYRNYDVHNLYGWSQCKPTIDALQATYPGRRGFVLTRSTFPGASHHVTHWLGDNVSTWTHLRRSIIAMLEFSMFGFPHTGPDICGFLGEPTPELCKRWMQLGAFYPYSRNHNSEGNKEQDPGFFGPEVAFASQFWMRIRYNLLPYMYTLMYHAHTEGLTVARPLFFEFPKEPMASMVDTQFMLGSAYMIAPVLDAGYNQLRAYMPRARWVNHVTGTKHDYCSSTTSQYVTFQGNYDLALFHRGGSIAVHQGINEGNIISTMKTRHEPLSIHVAFDCQNKAKGDLFWDDGDSINTIKQDLYWLTSYEASLTTSGVKLSVRIDHKSLDEKLGEDLYYSSITLHNLPKPPRLYKITCPKDQPCAPPSSTSAYGNEGKTVIEMHTNQPALSQAFDLEIEF